MEIKSPGGDSIAKDSACRGREHDAGDEGEERKIGGAVGELDLDRAGVARLEQQ